MGPKRGAKRKASKTAGENGANGSPALVLPDRESWSGWVEVENEPEHFTIMLRQMGVEGLQAVEVLDIPYALALPRPVYGLIFLFRYRDEDMRMDGNEHESSHVWFANQVPDYACASVALLNIVNNIQDLKMGKQLSDFKAFTKDMDPLTRGDTIDNFDFVKRIHNSFASQNDFLNADAIAKDKFNKYKKKVAAAKGRETKAAKKAEKEQIAEDHTNASSTTKASTTGKQRKQPALDLDKIAGEAPSKTSNGVSETHSDAGYDPKSKINGTVATAASNGDSDSAPRRSGRSRKPAQHKNMVDDVIPDEDGNGHHFVAYVPVGNHVWMLDGLNHFPQDLGCFEAGVEGGTGEWMDVAATDLMIRMVKGGDDYSLMAIVADPVDQEKAKLAENVKTLQTIDTQLDILDGDWRSMDGGETKKEVVTGISETFGLSQADVNDAELPDSIKEKIAKGDDLLALLQYRQDIVKKQAGIRADALEALRASQRLDTDGIHLRHDYDNFVRSWVGALAEQGVLADLVGG
ncbi:unnamed protein product [Zymoseptoria tritici ST99CH_1A5]|uniref:Ubiquitin carboxyl-terminal hydrolase n=3 Tax=Zymoseptoria tritici TaxID=1047171 RepID=A0A1X7S7B7_ZYMT9|nr:unnamed protein product [Zymoseptoria tritici ST99CH_3D7]SMR60511.1 unnamed protein product [Zymoseptoria tritici ST99CH_1E4]SMR63623.1 unnamed protein product [Zymoseptoria tritici ST99CH_3D1]SMY28987.1 unnamed protein product [Zymoseptoria tritici ST99CH_1A5]